jgi:hypothetical protein
MNRFICTTCGRLSYSAARLEDLRDNRCIDPKCSGHVAYAEAQDMAEAKQPKRELERSAAR